MIFFIRGRKFSYGNCENERPTKKCDKNSRMNEFYIKKKGLITNNFTTTSLRFLCELTISYFAYKFT